MLRVCVVYWVMPVPESDQAPVPSASYAGHLHVVALAGGEAADFRAGSRAAVAVAGPTAGPGLPVLHVVACDTAGVGGRRGRPGHVQLGGRRGGVPGHRGRARLGWPGYVVDGDGHAAGGLVGGAATHHVVLDRAAVAGLGLVVQAGAGLHLDPAAADGERIGGVPFDGIVAGAAVLQPRLAHVGASRRVLVHRHGRVGGAGHLVFPGVIRV